MFQYTSKIIRTIISPYKNWPSVLFDLELKRPVRTLNLRDGRIISPTSGKGISGCMPLARLLNDKWKLLDFDDNLISLSDPVGTKFKCRYTKGYDFGHLVELYLDHSYGTRFDGKIVIDVGMSNGDSSIYFAMKGARKVIGVEPFQESYSLAVENIFANNLTGIIIPVNYALSSRSGRANFMTSSIQPNSNAISPTEFARTLIPFDSSDIVDTITLEDLINENGIDQVDLLKMDCEGCEYSVFRETGPDTLRRIREIILEFHNGGNEISGLLSKNGFEVQFGGDSAGYLRAVRAA